jgi:hypothetical protein
MPKKTMRPTTDVFAWLAAEVKAGKLAWQFQGDTGIPGTLAVLATHPSMPYPIGALWFRWRDAETLDIMNVWTFEPLRRCGIASYLFKQLPSVYPGVRRIWSQHGTESGAPWMRANGFIQRPDGWHYRPKGHCKK